MSLLRILQIWKIQPKKLKNPTLRHCPKKTFTKFIAAVRTDTVFVLTLDGAPSCPHRH